MAGGFETCKDKKGEFWLRLKASKARHGDCAAFVDSQFPKRSQSRVGKWGR